MPKYIVGKDTYTIPDDKVEGFIQTFPDARQRYKVGEDSYTIPVANIDGFLSTYPDAVPYEIPGYVSYSETAQASAAPKAHNYVEQESQKSNDWGLPRYVPQPSAQEELELQDKRHQAYAQDEQRNAIDNKLSEIEQRNNSQPKSSPYTINGVVQNSSTDEDLAISRLGKVVRNELQSKTKQDKLEGDKSSGLLKGISSIPAEDILTLGLSELFTNTTAIRALEKSSNGEPLTQSEKDVVDLMDLHQQAQGYVASRGGKTSGQVVGSGVVESIPYMAGFAATGGVGSLTSGLGRAAAKYALKHGAKRAIGRIAGAGTSALTKAAAMTPLQVGTYNNYADRTIAQYEHDVDGNVSKKDTPITERIYKATADSYSDVLSELSGAAYGKAFTHLVSEPVANIAKRVGVGVSLGNINRNAIVQTIRDRTGFNGAIGEFFEELQGGFTAPLLTGETERWRDNFSRESVLNTFLTTTLMSGGFAVMDAPRTISYTRELNACNKEAKSVLNSISDNDLKAQVSGAMSLPTIEEQAKAISAINWDKVSDQDAFNVGAYANIITTKSVFKGVDTEAKRRKFLTNIASSIKNGADVSNSQDTREKMNIAEEYDVATTPFSSEELETLNAVEDDSASDWLTEKYESLPEESRAEDIRVYEIFFSTRARKNGLIDGVLGGIDAKIAQSTAHIDDIAHKDGNVYSATIQGGTKVNIIGSGSIVLDNTGNIDYNKSDDRFVVKDSQGDIRMIPAKEIVSIASSESAETLKQSTRQTIMNQESESFAQQIEGRTKYQTGEEIDVEVEGNNSHLLIKGQNQDGTYTVTDGKSQINVSGEWLRDGVKNAALSSLRAEQPYRFNQELTFSVNGQDVHAQITATPNDGIYEVTPEREIDGESVLFLTADEITAMLKPASTKTVDATDEQPTKSYLEQIPVDDKGNPIFEMANTELSASALVEMNDGDHTEAIDTATRMLSILNKELAKETKAKSITGNDVLSIQKAKQDKKERVGKIESSLTYWTKVVETLTSLAQASTPITQTETAPSTHANTQSKAPIKAPNSYQSKLDAVLASGSDGLPTRDKVLYDIACGEVLFLWGDDGKSRGVESELFGKRRGSKRKAKASNEYSETLVTTNPKRGVTPEHYAERLAGINYNQQDAVDNTPYRDIILDVLQSITSRKDAFEQLSKKYGTETFENEDFEARAAHEHNLKEQKEIDAFGMARKQIDEIIANQVEDIDLSVADELFNEPFSDNENSSIFEKPNPNRDGRAYSSKKAVRGEAVQQGTDRGVSRSEQYAGIRVNADIDSQFQKPTSSREEININSDGEVGGDGSSLPSGYDKGAEFSGENFVENHGHSIATKTENIQGLAVRDETVDNGLSQGNERGDSNGKRPIDGRSGSDSMEQPLPQTTSISRTKANPTREIADNARDIPESDTGVSERTDVEQDVSQAETDVNTNPTEAQKVAGNYKKGHISVNGFDITIEQPKGSVRSGVDSDGRQWSQTMNNTYGYFKQTKGKDGDHIDVFLGDKLDSDKIFVVDQINRDSSFDEHKVMMGFADTQSAKEAYLSNYEDGWQGLGNISEVSLDGFKEWVASGTRKMKPFADYKKLASSDNQSEAKVMFRDGDFDVQNQDIRFRVDNTLNGEFENIATEYNELIANRENNINFENDLTDWRDRKADVVRRFFDELAHLYDIETPIWVFNSSINSNVLIDLCRKIDSNVSQSDISNFIEYWVDPNNKSIGAYVQETDIILVDIARSDKISSLQTYKRVLVHEYVHAINSKRIFGSTLSKVYAEVKNIPSFKKILSTHYLKCPNSRKGDEAIAYSINSLMYETKGFAFDRFINNEITAEEAINYLKSDIPYTKRVLLTILNIFNDEQRKRENRGHKSVVNDTGSASTGKVENPNRIDDGRGRGYIRSIERRYLNDIENKNADILNAVENLSSQLNTPIRVITDTSEITPEQPFFKRKREAKGWYDVHINEVVIVLPNATSVSDAVRTVLHEAVGHKGLREMLGSDFDGFLVDIFNNADAETRRKIATKAVHLKLDTRLATEEYLAELAEDGIRNPHESNTVWQTVKDAFSELLRKIGINIKLTDNDLRYLLWKSYNRLKEGDSLIEQASKITADAQISEIIHKDDIQFRHYFGDNSGYVGYSMSRRANEARIEGRFPITDFKKEYQVTGNSFDILSGLDLIQSNEWHHTSSYGNKTPFWEWEEDFYVEIYRDNKKKIDEISRDKSLSTEQKSDIILQIFNEDLRTVGNNHEKDIITKIQQKEREVYGKYTSLIEPVRNNLYKVEREINSQFLKNLPKEKIIISESGNNHFIGKNKKLILIEFNGLNNPSWKDSYHRKTKNPLLTEDRNEFLGYANTAVKSIDQSLFANSQDLGNRIKALESERDDLQRRVESEVRNNIRFRDNSDLLDATTDYNAALEKRTIANIPIYKLREAYQDSMLSLKELQKAITESSGKPIKDHEDAYMFENQMSSISTYETEIYRDEFFKPIITTISALEKQGETYESVKMYLFAKHGLERNEVFAVRAAERAREKHIQSINKLFADGIITKDKYDKTIEQIKATPLDIKKYSKDYSGLTALAKIDDKDATDYKTHAQELVDRFESSHKNLCDELWIAINAATKQTLRKSYESGNISEENYEDIKGMFNYYIPLRGFDEKVAHDVYEYIDTAPSIFNPTIKSAKGRKSLAEDPIATLANVAESTILAGNKNLLKRRFYNMAMNHKTDLLTIGQVWYANYGSDFNPKWEQRMPEIPENATATEIAEIIKEFEVEMMQMESEGRATQKRNKLNIEYRASKREASEHCVVANMNGKQYVVYVNGNPRAAQAVNGLTNPDASENKFMQGVVWCNRQMAANFTTRNPAFVISNFSRDVILATAAVSVKEDSEYLAKFTRNYLPAMASARRCLFGKPDLSREIDRHFMDFLKNGGETGYTNLHSVERYKGDIKRMLNQANGKVDPAKALRVAARAFSTANRWAEDVSRFNTYLTSRQVGRSVQQSIANAKDITVNFNKKGAGGPVATTLKSLLIFFNAAVQSLNNIGRLAKRHPIKFTAMVSSFFVSGAMMPLINSLLISLLGGDDDAYNDLPDWVRRNNLCFYIGDGCFATIPLPIELRALYGMGEMGTQYILGNMEHKNIGFEAVKQVTALLPLDPLGGSSSYIPTSVKPIVEAYVINKDFFGKPIYRQNDFNKNMPEYTKAYKGTSQTALFITETLNTITGGDKYTPGVIDINPARVEHLIEGYFGGMAKTMMQTGKTLSGIAKAIENGDSDEIVTRNIPVINRFVNETDERNAYSTINEKYFNYKAEYDMIKQRRTGYNNELEHGIMEYAARLQMLYKSGAFERYAIFKELEGTVKRLNDMQREYETALSDREKKRITSESNKIKALIVNKLDRVNDNVN